jgi:acyl-coenzyme A thioesterase PaaI-like protein
MDPAVKQAIYDAVRREPFAQTMNMQLVELELGYAAMKKIFHEATIRENSPTPGITTGCE